jgi:hypothetical protein
MQHCGMYLPTLLSVGKRNIALTDPRAGAIFLPEPGISQTGYSEQAETDDELK